MSSPTSIPAIAPVAALARTATGTANTERAPAARHGQPAVPPSPSRTRRDGLIDAMTAALGAEGVQRDRPIEQAVARFAHALIHDLRTIGGDGEAAFARRDVDGIGQRLDALASAAAAQARAIREPSPLTATTAALHVMQVPSSRLIEAFAALRQAVPSLAEVSNGSADARGELAVFLQRLQPSPPDTALGALLDAKV